LSEFGGLIRNGDFEQEVDGKPAHWSKVGGTLTLSDDSYRGVFAAALESDTSSLKWIHQVATVQPGGWYGGAGRGRVVIGSGEVFFRISWYESDDGSGTSLSQADGPIVSSLGWSSLSVGPVQAPADAHSARVRLMVRPASASLMTGAFDDVFFASAQTPDATPTPTPGGGTAPVSPLNVPTSSIALAGSTRAAPPPGSSAAARTATPESFRLIAAIGSKTLRISEIMSDAVGEGTDSSGEWVELLNTGSEAIDLGGWKIGDARALDDLPAASVPPGGFIVVAARLAVFPADVTVVRVSVIGGGLNNSGDVVRLFAPDGDEVDSVSFGDNASVFDPAPPAPPAGATLGARVVGGDPAPENWALTDRPSPGAPNTFPKRATPASGESAVAAASDNPASGARPARLIVSDEGSPTPLIIGVAALCLFGFGIWNARVKMAETVGKWRR
jgi:hypothetical protein